MNINGINYTLISKTEIRAGRFELKLQRPNGRRVYFAVLYENGTMSEVV